MSGIADLNALLANAYRAAALVEAISGLTESDQCSVSISTLNNLADMTGEALLSLIEDLSAAR